MRVLKSEKEKFLATVQTVIGLVERRHVLPVNGIVFISNLIEGRLSDYQRVIPKGNRHVVTLGRAPLLASLWRAAILTSERFRGIRLQVMPGALRIASNNAAQEEANEGLDVDYSGATIEIGLNVVHVTDVLANSQSEMVSMALNDAHSSVLFSSPGQAGFAYVVSPMRL